MPPLFVQVRGNRKRVCRIHVCLTAHLSTNPSVNPRRAPTVSLWNVPLVLDVPLTARSSKVRLWSSCRVLLTMCYCLPASETVRRRVCGGQRQSSNSPERNPDNVHVTGRRAGGDGSCSSDSFPHNTQCKVKNKECFMFRKVGMKRKLAPF